MWNLVWNFCSCKYLKSDLLRAWSMTRSIRVHVTWLDYKFGTFHPYPWQNPFIYTRHDFFMYVIYFIHIYGRIYSCTRDMIRSCMSLFHPYLWHDPFIYTLHNFFMYVTYFIYTDHGGESDFTYLDIQIWHTSSISMTRPFHTHVTRLFDVCDIFHPYLRHDLFTYTWYDSFVDRVVDMDLFILMTRSMNTCDLTFHTCHTNLHRF